MLSLQLMLVRKLKLTAKPDHHWQGLSMYHSCLDLIPCNYYVQTSKAYLRCYHKDRPLASAQQGRG